MIDFLNENKIIISVVTLVLVILFGVVYFFRNTSSIKDEIFVDNHDKFYINNNKVYFNDVELMVDTKTFSYLKGYYGSDKNKVFYAGLPITGADPKTFEVLGGENYQYARDKDFVYVKGSVLSSNPDDFLILNDKYSKDSSSVFLESNKINGADPKTFEIIQDLYSKDKDNVYYSINKLNILDPESFEVIDNILSIDKNNLYYRGVAVEGLNISNLKHLGNGYFKDSKNIFKYNFDLEKIDTFDFETFEIIGTACSVDNLSNTSFVKDKNGIYFDDTKISDDIDGFKIIDELKWGDLSSTEESIAKDSNGLYLGCGYKKLGEGIVFNGKLEYLGDGKITDGSDIYILKKDSIDSIGNIKN